MDAPDSAYAAPVTNGARLLLLLLWRHARGDRPTVWPSVPRLAQITGQHERTIAKQLRVLSAAGLISRVGKGPHGVTIWRVAPWPEGHPLPLPEGAVVYVAPAPLVVSTLPRGAITSLEEAQVEAQPTDQNEDQESGDVEEDSSPPGDSGRPSLPESSHPPKPLTTAQKRKVAARSIWDAHEGKCVETGIGRKAKGGGLRKPTDADIRAIVRCSTTIRKQEGIEERTAWLILRDAGIAAVDAAARARDEGDEWGDKLVGWRRRDPFGGKKLGPMLEELEKSRRNRSREESVPEGREGNTDEERKALEERVRRQRLRVVNGDEES